MAGESSAQSPGEGVGVLLLAGTQEELAPLAGRMAEETLRLHIAVGRTEGLLAVARMRPDLVVITTGCDGFDGYAVCEAVQRQAGENECPALVLMGPDRQELALRAFAMGANDYLSWPASPDVILAKVLAQASRAEAARLLREQLRARELELGELQESLLEVDREAAFGRVLGGIVHHLRTPLATATYSLDDLVTDLGPEAVSAVEPALGLVRRGLGRLTQAASELAARVALEEQASPAPLELSALVAEELVFLRADPRLRYEVTVYQAQLETGVEVHAVGREVAHLVRSLIGEALDRLSCMPSPELHVATIGDDHDAQLSLRWGSGPQRSEPIVGGTAPPIGEAAALKPEPPAPGDSGSATGSLDERRRWIAGELARRNGATIERRAAPNGHAMVVVHFVRSRGPARVRHASPSLPDDPSGPPGGTP